MKPLPLFACALALTFAAAAQSTVPPPGSQNQPEQKKSSKTVQVAPDVKVPAKGAEKGSPKHIFFIVPAYNVDYLKYVRPMTPHEKLQDFLEGAYDPIGLAAGATEALLEHSKVDGFCGYGSGIEAYGKCYASALTDSTWSSFLGDYALPVLWHQDPRYFRLGEGSVLSRAWYSVTRTFIARSDNGGWTFSSASLAGTAIAAATSNLYYPKQDRGWSLSMSRVAWDLGGTVIFNLEAEFWPDIKPHLMAILP